VNGAPFRAPSQGEATKQMATLITAYEVPPEADEAFAAGWERSRPAGAMTLHRALRADAALRFVVVARGQSVVDLGGALPFTAHPGRYAVVDEDGRPEDAGGVVLITFSEVPAGEDDGFLAARERLHELLAARQGYLGSRLHRSLEPADFAFVDVMRWSSPLMFARALQQPEIARTAASTGGHRALYLPVS
jgi:hypothetical protein